MRNSVKAIINRINKQRSISVAALLISLSYLTSRLLGLVRDRLLASNFGLSAQTDAYSAAFRIPDLLFTLLVSGAFAVSFIPIFVGYIERKKIDEAWEVASIVMNLIIILTIILGLATFVWTEPLVRIIAPGFDPERFHLTVNLTRIMLVTPLLFGISSVLGAIQQSFQRFILFALASVFYNVGIIIGIVFFEQFFQVPIYGVAYGVVAGTALQAIMQFVGVIGLGFRYQLSIKLWHPAVMRIFKLMVPRSLDLGLEQINTIVVTAIGSQLAAGSLTSYYYANNLKNVPLGLFGGAISTAVFPSLIRAAKSKDKSRLPSQIVQTIRFVLFFVLPSAAIAIIMRGYIVRLLLGFGDQTTADVLGWLAAVIVSQSVFFIVARIFYALEDTKTPLYTSLATFGLNILLCYVFSAEYGVLGLAMSLSTVTTLELIILLLLLRRKIGTFGLRNIIQGGMRMVMGSTLMAGAMYIMITYFFPLYRDERGWRVLAPKFMIVSMVGLGIYLLACWLMRLDEMRTVVRYTQRKYLSRLRRNIGA